MMVILQKKFHRLEEYFCITGFETGPQFFSLIFKRNPPYKSKKSTRGMLICAVPWVTFIALAGGLRLGMFGRCFSK